MNNHKMGSIDVKSLANSISFNNLRTDGFLLKSDSLTFNSDNSSRYIDVRVDYLNLDSDKRYSLSSPIKLNRISNSSYTLTLTHKPMSYFKDREIITGISINSKDKFIGTVECYGEWYS